MTRTARHCRQLGSLALLAAAFALTGCKDKAPASDTSKPAEGKSAVTATPAKPATGGKVASCNFIKAESMCRQYAEANLEAAGEQSIRDLCKNNYNGEFKLEECPKDKRIGSCVTPEGTKVFYSEGPLPLSADKAEKSCKEGQPAGEWKAG